MKTTVINPELVEAANREHRLAAEALTTAVEHAAKCGGILRDIKQQVGHGHWLTWLAEHFEGSARTANDYMRISCYLAETDSSAADFTSLRDVLRAIRPSFSEATEDAHDSELSRLARVVMLSDALVDELRWQQAEEVVRLLDSGMSAEDIGAGWISHSTGQPYGTEHVERVAVIWRKWAA